MLLTKAQEYLKDVLEHKRCIPYSRYDHSVGRCSAAIQFGLTKGRYPEKSVRIMLNLLTNAKANAEVKNKSLMFNLFMIYLNIYFFPPTVTYFLVLRCLARALLICLTGLINIFSTFFSSFFSFLTFSLTSSQMISTWQLEEQ